MEEISLQEIPTEETALIMVKQLPVIIQHLDKKAVEIREKTEQAMRLACSPETLTDVRAVRSALNKEKAELEEQRKKVKQAVAAPYMEFEAVYKKCVLEPFNKADADLAAKISETESGIIGACVEEMKAYFAEMAASERIDWLTYDRLNLKIGLTEAKTKHHNKPREAIAAFIVGVSEDVQTINRMESADEVMVEYKQCLNLSRSIAIVSERHERIAEQKRKKEEWEAQQSADREAAAKVEAVVPDPAPAPVPEAVFPAPNPKPAPAPTPKPSDDGKVYKLNFSVMGTKTQLVEFKKQFVAYCEERGIKYE